MDRRQLLRSAAHAALGLAALGVAGVELAGCGAPAGSPPAGAGGATTTTLGAPASSTPAVTATSVAAGPPDWAALASSLTGRLVLPGSAAYPGAIELFDPSFDSVHPAAVAYCASPGDVSRSIAFARAHGVALATRSGGHSFAGYSTGQGRLVIDVGAMATVAVDPAAGTARVGAGVRLVDLYSALAGQGVALAGGSCPTVGIAGLTLGGGLGVVDRQHGLSCDALQSVDIVTADSRLLSCDAGSHPELYWASQGGGGGSFGVATSFTFLVHPTDQLALFTLVWPWAAAAEVLGAWQAWAQATPDALWSNCQMGAGPGATLSLRVTGVWVGTAGECSVVLAPLLRAVRQAPTYEFVAQETYMRAMLIEAGCESYSVAECHLPGETPSGSLGRSPFATRSNFVTEALPAAGVSAAVAAVEARQGVAAPGSGGIVVSTTGGVINQVPADATAFVHRDTLFLVEYNAGWDTGASAGIVAANQAWLAHAWSAMQPYVSVQAYQNYADPTLANWQLAYYGANFPRLVRVKAAYDPDDVFHFAQSIPTH